jgi:hypothetical protein
MSSRNAHQSFQVVFVIAAVLVVPATIALRKVAHPSVLQVSSDNPTPLGYTWSLLLFIVPIVALAWWFACRPDLQFPRKAFWRTIAVLAPLGFVLDLLFGNTFFTFPNKHATLGIGVHAVGGAIPIEEFVFYLTGFMLVLLSYIWCSRHFITRVYHVSAPKSFFIRLVIVPARNTARRSFIFISRPGLARGTKERLSWYGNEWLRLLIAPITHTNREWRLLCHQFLSDISGCGGSFLRHHR